MLFRSVLIRGREAIGAFLADSVFVGGVRIRLVPINANRTPAFALYSGVGAGALGLYALLVVDVSATTDVSGTTIDRMNVFTNPRLPARFGLANAVPA